MKPGDLVLVTGASGFIGGRLVEKLILEHGLRVRVLAAHFGRCSRIARFRLEFQKGRLDDAASLARACQGVRAVFHLAYDWGSPETNIVGTRLLAEAALAASAERFVHVSTVSAYGDTPDGPLSETTPRGPLADTYSATKARIEDELLDLHRTKKLPLVVLQPTVVYGPFCSPWTVRILRWVREGRVPLPENGQGVCNAVYVDDVADAAVLAAQTSAAVGGKFLVSGPEPVTWEEFFRAYERMAGVRSVTPMHTAELREAIRRANDEKNLPVAVLAAIWRRPRLRQRLLGFLPTRWCYRGVRACLSDRALDWLRVRLDPWSPRYTQNAEAHLPPLQLPEPFLVKLYASRSRVSIDHARKTLGYSPRFDLARGMTLTEQWARWANLLPSP